MKTVSKGYLYLIGAAISYASMSVLVKFLSYELAPFSQTFLRLVVSGLFTLALVLKTKRSPFLKSRSDYLLIIPMGILGYALSTVAFTYSFDYIPIGSVLFIMSSYPIHTAFLAFFLLKEKITSRNLASLAILVIALFLLFQPIQLDNLTGNLFALTASVTFALYIVFSRILSRNNNAPETITLWSVWLAVVTSGLGALTFESFSLNLSPAIWLGVVVFGFFNFAGYNLINKGFQLVEASRGSMVVLLEPIIGSMLGLIFFREIPTISFLAGSAVMILAILLTVSKKP